MYIPTRNVLEKLYLQLLTTQKIYTTDEILALLEMTILYGSWPEHQSIEMNCKKVNSIHQYTQFNSIQIHVFWEHAQFNSIQFIMFLKCELIRISFNSWIEFAQLW